MDVILDFYEGNEKKSVTVTNNSECKANNVDSIGDVIESWEEFHVLEEHSLDPNSIKHFIKWHNELRFSQLIETRS